MDGIPAHEQLLARAGLGGPSDQRPASYKAIGISLAVGSGLFIGSSFVLKKYGLLKANEKYKEVAGEGYGYLKNCWWWTGMILMILGELCNFVAYAFTDAILVTPLGALSVVITTILSAVFLKERLSMVGKVSCFLCIVGAVIIVMNAPESSSVSTIHEMQGYVVSPGFLAYTGVIVLGAIATALWAGPRWGKQNMLVYISVCSWVGGLSVVATQGLGAAVVAQAGGTPQFNQWFLYVLLVFVIATLLTEIIYLNKALNLFNAAMVTPTYYVYFTSTTIITSAVLFRGFRGTPTSIVTVVLGFLTICAGVVLLQLSKSAKDVPDAAVFKGDLDQIHTIAEQEEPESEPRADAIRGASAIIRRFSTARQKREMEELRRLHDERLQEQLEVVSEDSPTLYEWDGIRRRRTTVGSGHSRSTASGWVPPLQRPSQHPPLGMTHFPTDEELERLAGPGIIKAITGSIRARSRTTVGGLDDRSEKVRTPLGQNPAAAMPLDEIMSAMSGPPGTAATLPPRSPNPSLPDTAYYGAGAEEHNLGLPVGLRLPRARLGAAPDPPRSAPHPTPTASPAPTLTPPPLLPHGGARRHFSFQNMFRRHPSGEGTSVSSGVSPGPDNQEAPQAAVATAAAASTGGRIAGCGTGLLPGRGGVGAGGGTEEERLGLVKGDSHSMPQLPRYDELSEEESDRSSLGYFRSDEAEAEEEKQKKKHSEGTAQHVSDTPAPTEYRRGIVPEPPPAPSPAPPSILRRQGADEDAERAGAPLLLRPDSGAEVAHYEAQRLRWADSSRARSRESTPGASSTSLSRPAAGRREGGEGGSGPGEGARSGRGGGAYL